MSADKKQPAGSPAAGGPAFLAVAKVRRPHGVHGELVVEIYTDFPERLQPGKTVYVSPENKQLTISSRRSHNEGLILGFEDITNPEEAGWYRNRILYILASDVHELQEGEFYFHDLLGLNVINESDMSLGTLTEIMETGANDVYIVTDLAGTELLIPAIPDVVLNVDLDAKTMKVRLLPGLMDDETQDL
ncbi:MAG TPA: ribosome maturation factor RimM [Anaerolineales bacterium]